MRGTGAVALRVLRSLRGDRVTLALVLATPWVIMFLFGEVLDAAGGGRFNGAFLPPVVLAVFVFMLTYILTGIGFLRERQRGTLERVLASPASRAGIVAGYFVGYGVLAVIQASMLLGAGLVFLELDFAHGIALFYGIELLSAATALGIGIFVSVIARTELQVIQAIPMAIAPQIILSGVFVPVEAFPRALELVARALPLTYVVEGMAYVVLDQGMPSDLSRALLVLGGFTLASVVGGGLVLRRAA